MGELTKQQRLWKKRLDALERFDGTAVEYARLHDLDVRTLYVYKGRLRKLSARSVSTSKFVAVRAAAPIGHQGVMVALPNGVRLALTDLDAPGLLERLARL